MYLTAALAIAASQADPVASRPEPSLPELQWNWDAPQRYYVEAEVNLPELMWWEAEFNKNARVFGFQLRAVMTCQGTERESARKRLVQCSFEDAAIIAAALPGDQGRLQPILDEYDALLSKATLALVVRNDGRVTDLNLDGVPYQNLRTRQRKETLRQLSRFLAAGLEVSLPRSRDAVWLTNQALFCTMPSNFGTANPVEAVHQGAMDGTRVQIATQGRGIMAAGNSDNRYTCDFESITTWDPAGHIERRVWTMRGEPTASSPIALGAAGFPYLQKGSITALAAGEAAPDLGPTQEVKPEIITPSALQQGAGPSSEAGQKWGN